MVECRECQLINRRAFLRRAGVGAGALALADPILQTVASTFAQTPGGTGNLLVLCELNGGMDALSFLAPFTNSVYLEKRPVLALKAEDVTPLSDHPDLGISNLFPFFNELYAHRQLAIVQQVAYPDGNGSHFESQEIYEFGVRNLASASATSMPWYERLRSTYFDEPFGVLDTRSIGDPQRYGYPDNTYRQAAQDAFGRLALMKQGRNARQQAVLDAYSHITDLSSVIRDRTAEFETSGDARGQFFRTAQLASAKLGTQILRLQYGGFDTHGTQVEANLDLFPRLDREFRQFVEDLRNLDLWDRTCIVFYTEFGRRNAENGSPGTDHGYGGHILLAGPRVNGGLHGQNVTSADLREDSLPYYVDFRAVFSQCVRDWLGFDPRPVFQVGGETYDENVGSSLFV